MGLTIAYQCMGGNVVDIQLAIADMVYLRIGNKRGTWREEVSTLSLGNDISRDGIDAVVGHEVVNIQVAHLDVGVIAHSSGIERTFGLDRSPTLASGDVCIILLTIGFDTSLGRHGRNTIVALHITRQHGHHKAQILGAGRKLHIGTQTLWVVEVSSKTCSSGMEGGRQRHLQIMEVHVLHISLQQTANAEWVFGPTLTHGCRQVSHKGHQVLLT